MRHSTRELLRRFLGAAAVAALVAGAPADAETSRIDEPFAIQVIDDATGRGVPLVELQTTAGVVFVTDSAGVVAFDEPGLMNQRVWFGVTSHGYEYPPDGFGIRGVAFDVSPGRKGTVKIKRRNIAERLYRTTGLGIYRDSVLVGRTPPTKQPLVNAKVMGSDSVQNAIYHGRLWWFWGDTNRPAYPLGNFHMPGATSRLPADGGLDPAVGVNLEYFTAADGFAKETSRMPSDGPTWLDGVTVLADPDGRERLFAAFAKIRPPLTTYRRGICEWNDEKEKFEQVIDYGPDQPLMPFGHTVRRRAQDGDGPDTAVGTNAAEYVYFGDPFPHVRVRATAEDFARLHQYEGYTCLKSGTNPDDAQLDRNADGRLRYAWRRGVPASAPLEPQLFRSGKLKPDEALVRLRDRVSGKPVAPHRGTVNWNDYRRKWIAIFVEQGGTSPLGEVWYAESDSPMGPWTECVKIVTHEKYSYYNPKHHPYFDQQSGRIIYFEGTYTHTFSGNAHKTPRYDYNQIMYRVDLADPRLASP